MARRIQDDREALEAARLLFVRGYSILQVKYTYDYLDAEERVSRMTSAYRSESLSGEFDDDGSPEHDD